MNTFGHVVASHALRLGALTAYGRDTSASIYFEGRDAQGCLIGKADLEVTPDNVSLLHLEASPCDAGAHWSRGMARHLGTLERHRSELVQ